LLDTPGRKTGVPAKLFEYFGAARPVLALADPGGDLSWALHASGMPHRVAPPRDVGAIFAGLVALRDGLRGNRFELPPTEQLARFSRAWQARVLAGHLDQLFDEQNPFRLARPAEESAPKAHHAPERAPTPATPHRPHYARA